MDSIKDMYRNDVINVSLACGTSSEFRLVSFDIRIGFIDRVSLVWIL